MRSSQGHSKVKSAENVDNIFLLLFVLQLCAIEMSKCIETYLGPNMDLCRNTREVAGMK